MRANIAQMGGDELTPAYLQRLMELFYRAIVDNAI